MYIILPGCVILVEEDKQAAKTRFLYTPAVVGLVCVQTCDDFMASKGCVCVCEKDKRECMCVCECGDGEEDRGKAGGQGQVRAF